MKQKEKYKIAFVSIIALLVIITMAYFSGFLSIYGDPFTNAEYFVVDKINSDGYQVTAFSSVNGQAVKTVDSPAINIATYDMGYKWEDGGVSTYAADPLKQFGSSYYTSAYSNGDKGDTVNMFITVTKGTQQIPVKISAREYFDWRNGGALMGEYNICVEADCGYIRYTCNGYPQVCGNPGSIGRITGNSYKNYDDVKFVSPGKFIVGVSHTRHGGFSVGIVFDNAFVTPYCGDGICQSDENVDSCFNDCAADTIKDLNKTLQIQIIYLNQINASIQEKARLINLLTTNLDDQLVIVNELQLKVDQKGEMIKALTSDINRQAELIDQMNATLDDKVALIKQLTAENGNQAELMKQMKLSFTTQGEILGRLDLDITKDASTIKELSSSVEDEAEIIKSMHLTIDEEAQLIKALNLKIEDEKTLVAALKHTIEDEQELLKKLNLTNGTPQITDYTWPAIGVVLVIGAIMIIYITKPKINIKFKK